MVGIKTKRRGRSRPRLRSAGVASG